MSPREGLAPTLGWTRPAAIVLAGIGLVLPGIVIFDLLTDHGCANEVGPHPRQALLLAAVAVLAAWGGVAVHRSAARWVARHVTVRSKLANAWGGTLTLLPAIGLGLGSAALAGWLYFAYAMHICLSFDWLVPR
jgi:hypothetical protein